MPQIRCLINICWLLYWNISLTYYIISQKVSSHVCTLLLLSFLSTHTHTQHSHNEQLFCSLDKKFSSCGGVPRDKMQWLQIQQSSQGNFWLNFLRVAEKKEQRSVKFQKRTIPASPWRNAGRMGITFAAFEALLSPSTTAGTAHLTAQWPALKEEMQGRWMPAWSFQT